LSEPEEKSVQNRLEDWWLIIKERQEKSHSKLTVFMSEIARLSSDGLDRIFGKKLISAQSIVVSACYSLASIFLLGSFLLVYSKSPDMAGPIVFFFIAVALVVFATFSGKAAEGCFVFVVVLSIAILWGIFSYVISKEGPTKIFKGAGFLLALVFPIASDFFFIAITRRLLRWSAGVDSFGKIIAIIIVNNALAFALFLGPFLLLYWEPSWIHPYLQDFYIGFPAGLIVGSNLTVLLPALVFVLLAFIMLVHRLFWPALHRPIYALQRFSVFQHRKVCGILGCTILATSLRGLGANHVLLDILNGLKIFFG
jgi:hypothetical protein